ncbi:MAG: hypothetical protein ACO1SV_10665 [Fimbriimonas sp.]
MAAGPLRLMPRRQYDFFSASVAYFPMYLPGEESLFIVFAKLFALLATVDKPR